MREAQGGVVDGKLFVFGGFIYPFWGPKTFKSVSYDPRTNTWQTHPNIPLAGHGVRRDPISIST
jgi:N-acetylneuraminic acid mutarotase